MATAMPIASFRLASLSWRSEAWDVDVHGLKPQGTMGVQLECSFSAYMTQRLRLKRQHGSDLFFGGGFLCNQFLSPPKKNKKQLLCNQFSQKKTETNLTLNDFGVSTSCFRDLDLFLSSMDSETMTRRDGTDSDQLKALKS